MCNANKQGCQSYVNQVGVVKCEYSGEAEGSKDFWMCCRCGLQSTAVECPSRLSK
jgi:hypothetical protein